MPLSHIEHFLVAADDIDATRDWYARVLGMKAGPHPAAGEIQKKYLGRTSP
jgi:catechol 2,3-dioxygenase-like lactoylglutathione lyase family enzyme